jgi:hypothetical protein
MTVKYYNEKRLKRGEQPLPDEAEYAALKIACKHYGSAKANPNKKDEESGGRESKSCKSGCPCFVRVTHVWKPDGSGVYFVVHSSNTNHNDHLRSQGAYQYYASSRKIQGPQVQAADDNLWKALDKWQNTIVYRHSVTKKVITTSIRKLKNNIIK